MRREIVKYGLATGMLILGLGLGGAEASVNRPIPPASLGIGSAVTPAAMCGIRCRSGGFYVPGPPGVCFARGLNYCGPSGGGYGGPPWAGRGFYGGGPYWRHRGPYGGPYGGPRHWGYGGPRYGF